MTTSTTRGLAILAATGATYTGWLTARQFLDVDLLLTDGTTVTWPAVVLTTAGAGRGPDPRDGAYPGG
jgi:hypothetical protein